jgi:hypothetical protein
VTNFKTWLSGDYCFLKSKKDEPVLHDELRQIIDGLRFYQQPRGSHDIIALRVEDDVHLPNGDIISDHH